MLGQIYTGTQLLVEKHFVEYDNESKIQLVYCDSLSNATLNLLLFMLRHLEEKFVH